jgi:GNAT superfamily N-acetyltransferase
MKIRVRDAVPTDAAILVEMINELAEYQKHSDPLALDEDRVFLQMSSEHPPFRALVAERDDRVFGFALYYFGYSTWEGRRTLQLEDLYVRADSRGLGIGQMLMDRLAFIARENDCARLEWSVIDWNHAAKRFYESLGARINKGWTKYRLPSPKPTSSRL